MFVNCPHRQIIFKMHKTIVFHNVTNTNVMYSLETTFFIVSLVVKSLRWSILWNGEKPQAFLGFTSSHPSWVITIKKWHKPSSNPDRNIFCSPGGHIFLFVVLQAAPSSLAVTSWNSKKKYSFPWAPVLNLHNHHYISWLHIFFTISPRVG